MIDRLALIGRYFCKQISPFWQDNRDVQGVTRLDGAWDKKKFGAPIFEPELFRKQMYCFEKSAYDIAVNFWLRAVIRRPGNCSPFPPSLRLWCYAIKLGKFSENKQIFESKHHELLFHKHLQFSNTIPHESCLDCQQRLLAAFHVSFCSFCATTMPAPRVFFRPGPVLVFLII